MMPCQTTSADWKIDQDYATPGLSIPEPAVNAKVCLILDITVQRRGAARWALTGRTCYGT